MPTFRLAVWRIEKLTRLRPVGMTLHAKPLGGIDELHKYAQRSSRAFYISRSKCGNRIGRDEILERDLAPGKKIQTFDNILSTCIYRPHG